MDVVQPAIAAVSGVAGVTLAAASALETYRARTHVERADAAHGIAWGLQSVGGIGGMWGKAPGWAAPAAYGLGLTGGAIQTAVGLYRLRTGWARRNRRPSSSAPSTPAPASAGSRPPSPATRSPSACSSA